MRIATAALLLVIASALAACVHETTVFHSPNRTNYFRSSADAVVPTDAPATPPSPAGEPVPSR